MPIYGYQCQACGHEFELMQKMSDPAPSNCPSCGKPEVRKQLSAAGFQLKGSGWYATDFKGSGKKPADKKDTGTKSSDTKSSDTKSSDTKSSDTKSSDTKSSDTGSGAKGGGSCAS